MKRAALYVGAVLCGTIAGAEPPETRAGEAATTGNLMRSLGEQHFARYCASCHGLDGRGDGPAAGALSKPPADLTRIAARRAGVFPAGEIAATIDGRFELPAHGSREMPIWGRRLAEPIAEDTQGEEVARGRIDILVEYLLSIQVESEPKQR
jgi:mono/diheme cytochrome c family protein